MDSVLEIPESFLKVLSIVHKIYSSNNHESFN